MRSGFEARAWALLLAALPVFAKAQTVELKPAYISGTIQVAGQIVDSANIRGSWTDPATGISYTANTSVSGSESYTLTVNAPEGASADYTVSVDVTLNGSQASLTSPAQSVSVTASHTSIADFDIVPGMIEATVAATGGSVASIEVRAYGPGTFSLGSAATSQLTLPVSPCTDDRCLQVTGRVNFAGGGSVLLEVQYASVDAGQATAVAWTVSPPVTTGEISGTVAVQGASAIGHAVSVVGPSPGQATIAGDGSFEIRNLAAGRYSLEASSSFDGPSRSLYHPDSSFSNGRHVDVIAGAATPVGVLAQLATLKGTLKLDGTKTLAQASSVVLGASGIPQTLAAGGSATTVANKLDGAYSLAVTGGSWAPASLTLEFYDPSPSSYLSESLRFFDYQVYNDPIALAAGETGVRDLSYRTGSVTVNYAVVGGGTFSQPYLRGNCRANDDAGQIASSYIFDAYGNQVEVSLGSVSFVGMPARCSLAALAQVGGSQTTFGSLSVNVEPGVVQEVDLGGPSLTVTSPLPDLVTSSASLVVSGAASDDQAVASVTVNGQPATLTPDAQVESLSFSATVALAAGANPIETVATDPSGKTATDRRTVYRDAAPPALLWTPAEGAVSPVADVVVTGTADDDAGVRSLTVNGVPVAIESGAAHVSFSVPLTLFSGPNFIAVVATDISGRVTAQTHKVTVGASDTTAPLITPVITGTLGGNGWYTSDVSVGWTVSDPESVITASSGCAARRIKRDTAGVTLTCSATSQGGSATNSVTIKRDTSAPLIAGFPAGSCRLWPPDHKLVRVAKLTASDPLSGLAGPLRLSVTSSEPVVGRDDKTTPDWVIGSDGSLSLRVERSGRGHGRTYTITASASDAAGNVASASASCVVPHDQRGHGHHDDDPDDECRRGH